MRLSRWLPAVLLWAALTPAAASAAGPSQPVYKELPSGRYAVKVIGLITTTCGRSIEKELATLPEVESAKVDFDSETLLLTIKLNRTLKVKAISRALLRASHRVNLLSEYQVGAISYVP